LIINEELRKRQKAAQNSTFQTETPLKQKKQAEKLQKSQQPQKQQQFLNSLARYGENTNVIIDYNS